MDKGHVSFMQIMSEDPSVDYELLQQHYGKNSTEQLHLYNPVTAAGKKDSDEERTREKNIDSNPTTIDDFDKKKFKEGKLQFIGIKPRVDTNRKLSKKMQAIEEKL